MTTNPDDDELLRGYLLGELAEPAVDRLERRLLVEDDLFTLAEAVEAELLADLARGELPPAATERVRQRLAATARGRERLALARALNAAADRATPASVVAFPRREPATPAPAARWAALAAAVLLVVTGGSWLAWRALHEDAAPRLRQEIAAPPSRPTKRPAAAERPAPPNPSAAAPQIIATEPRPVRPQEDRIAPIPAKRPEPTVLVLSLATLRGEQPIDLLRLSPDVESVEIRIDLENLDHLKSFSAALRSQEGELLREQAGLEPQQRDGWRVLVLEVPAARLPAGRYRVEVRSGDEEFIEEFDVIRERQ